MEKVKHNPPDDQGVLRKWRQENKKKKGYVRRK